MHFWTAAGATLALTDYASAAMCITSGLLGLGASTSDLTSTFILQARAANGTRLTIVNDAVPEDGGFFLPIRLGAADTPLDSFTTPIFTLQGGTAYASGGTVFSTQSSPFLQPVPLYISADSSQQKETFSAVNATCDGEAAQVLRFNGLVPIPLASAAVNGSFATGSGLSSPILDNLLSKSCHSQLGPLLPLLPGVHHG